MLNDLRSIGIEPTTNAVHELHSTHSIEINTLEELVELVEKLGVNFEITPMHYWRIDGNAAFISYGGEY